MSFLRGKDIAISEDEDMPSGLFTLADHAPIGAALIGLLSRPTMDCDRCCASLLGDAGDGWSIDMLLVPARADLD